MRLLTTISIAIAAAFLLSSSSLHAQQVFLVINNNDDGPGSLRQAIEAANSTAGADSIQFDISIGSDNPIYFQPQTALPIITETVVIDGFSQPGASWATSEDPVVFKIVLDGSQAGDVYGLDIEADSCAIFGLTIMNFGLSGIAVGGNGNVIAGNAIGTGVNGQVAQGNGFGMDGTTLHDGIWIWSGTGNGVYDNLISGNSSSGVWVSSTEGGNEVSWNYIGTDTSGRLAIPNGYGIVFQNSPDNEAEGNVVSGNYYHGIVIANYGNDSGEAKYNEITANLVGVTASADDSLANGGDGIVVNGTNNLIGGTGMFEGNVVAGNRGNGISIVSPSETATADSNIVVGNTIGVDVEYGNPFPNELHGIYVEESVANYIGGPVTGTENVIASNGYSGIMIADGTIDSRPTAFHKILGNVIGTERSRLEPRGNGWDGIFLLDAGFNEIKGNLIVHNNLNGVLITGLSATGNLLQGNFIGAHYTQASMPNGEAGIDISSASENQIGGLGEPESNTIAYNGRAGITVNESAPGQPASKTDTDCVSQLRREVRGGIIASGAACRRNEDNLESSKTAQVAIQNLISRNRIFENAGVGIDLGRDGATPNDAGDADSGPNNLQNAPDLVKAIKNGDTVTITYMVDTQSGAAAYPLFVELYLASEDDEGSIFLDAFEYDTPQHETTAQITGLDLGMVLVATATDDAGNTSEFSAPVTVVSPPWVVVQPFGIDFGDVEIGQTAVDTIVVQSAGGDSLKGAVTPLADLSLLGMEIRAGDGPFSIPGQSELLVIVAFQPTVEGEKTATLSVSHNAENMGSPLGLPLSGKGVPVVAPNQAPVAVNDTLQATVGIETVLDVLANDTDADGDTLRVTGIPSPPLNGSTTFTTNEITYKSAEGFVGNDVFQYSISDGKGGVDQATVVVQVVSGTATDSELPGEVTTLFAAYPNPFGERSTVSWSLESAGPIRIELLDVLGRNVRTLFDGAGRRGYHELQIDAGGLPNGTYLIRMQTGSSVYSRQLSIVR